MYNIQGLDDDLLRRYYDWLYSNNAEEHVFAEADQDPIAFIACAKLMENAFAGDFVFDEGNLEYNRYLAGTYKYDKIGFRGDDLITLKSESHVKHNADGTTEYSTSQLYTLNGDKVDNHWVIGNIYLCGTPMFGENLTKEERTKFSLNCSRNGSYGRYPHDYPDVFVYHMARFADFAGAGEEVDNVVEADNLVYIPYDVHQPLVDAIRHPANQPYIRMFGSFENFIAVNYFGCLFNEEDKLYDLLRLPFYVYEKVEKQLSLERGRDMLATLRSIDASR